MAFIAYKKFLLLKHSFLSLPYFLTPLFELFVVVYVFWLSCTEFAVAVISHFSSHRKKPSTATKNSVNSVTAT